MENETQKKTVTAPAPVTASVPTARDGGRAPFVRGAHRPFDPKRAGGRKPGPRQERPKPEFDQKMINIRRVARVTAGGKRFNFSIAMVLGNRKGMVGVGTGKGADTALAIDKATKSAKKNMIRLPLTDTGSIPHTVSAKYSSGRIMIMPAKGKGMVAGSAVRDVLELGGVKDVVAKIISPSKNKLNIARATIDALKTLKARKSKVTVAVPVQGGAVAEKQKIEIKK